MNFFFFTFIAQNLFPPNPWNWLTEPLGFDRNQIKNQCSRLGINFSKSFQWNRPNKFLYIEGCLSWNCRRRFFPYANFLAHFFFVSMNSLRSTDARFTFVNFLFLLKFSSRFLYPTPASSKISDLWNGTFCSPGLNPSTVTVIENLKKKKFAIILWGYWFPKRSCTHTVKCFRNIVKSTRYQIVFTISRLIWI